MNPSPRTLIYLPDTPDRDVWERLAVEYCERNGYKIVGLVVRRDVDEQWADIFAMLGAGNIDLVVVCRRDHLPAGRLPRIEAITDGDAPSGGTRRRGRTN